MLTLLLVSTRGLTQSSKSYLVTSSNGDLLHKGSISNDSVGFLDISERIMAYRNEGYLLADINSFKSSENSLRYELYLGKRYSYSFINWDKFPQNFISLSGIRSRRDRYSPRAVTKEINRILEYSRETGYPFAQVLIDSAHFENSTLEIQLRLDPGPRIIFDSLSLSAVRQTKISFLQNWLSIAPGEVYQQSKYESISARINDLNFLTLKRPPTVAFVNNKAKVDLEVEEDRVNTFDGVIGFLQNEGNDRLTITGIVDLELYNLFGTGQALEFHWQQQRELSQSLDMSYTHPQLMRSVLGIKIDYNQLKEDTTFINRNFSFGLTLPWKNARIQLYYTRSVGRILASELNNELEPDIADFNIDNYNVDFSFGRFTGMIDDRGWKLQMSTTIGDKRILRNPLISEDFYNSTDLRSTQFRIGSSFEWQLSIAESFRVYQRMSFDKLINRQLFLNDLYRLGGLNSQRGFNELEFFADQYALSNLELRWIWNQESYLFVLYDQSFYQLDINQTKQSDQPLGVGLGLSLSTETGLFSLVYALGKTAGQPLALNQAKIHFGFTSRF